MTGGVPQRGEDLFWNAKLPPRLLHDPSPSVALRLWNHCRSCWCSLQGDRLASAAGDRLAGDQPLRVSGAALSPPSDSLDPAGLALRTNSSLLLRAPFPPLWPPDLYKMATAQQSSRDQGKTLLKRRNVIGQKASDKILTI